MKLALTLPFGFTCAYMHMVEIRGKKKENSKKKNCALMHRTLAATLSSRKHNHCIQCILSAKTLMLALDLTSYALSVTMIFPFFFCRFGTFQFGINLLSWPV